MPETLSKPIGKAFLAFSFDDWRENPKKWDFLVEVVIGAYLVNESIEQGINVYYWRHKNYEVDFIIEKGGKIIAIEVKSKMKRTSYPGLDFFQKKQCIQKNHHRLFRYKHRRISKNANPCLVRLTPFLTRLKFCLRPSVPR